MRTQSSTAAPTSEFIEVICRDCGGQGYIYGSTCKLCAGDGEYIEEVPLPCCMWCEQPTDGNLTRVIDWQDNVDSICQTCLDSAKSDPDAYGNARVLDRQVPA